MQDFVPKDNGRSIFRSFDSVLDTFVQTDEEAADAKHTEGTHGVDQAWKKIGAIKHEYDVAIFVQ